MNLGHVPGFYCIGLGFSAYHFYSYRSIDSRGGTRSIRL